MQIMDINAFFLAHGLDLRPPLETFFLNFGAPITFLAFCLWIYSLRIFKDTFKTLVREKQTILIGILAIFAASVTFLTNTVGYKVLSDETNLLSVGNMLTLFEKASNTTSWLFYFGAFHPIDINIPTRPLLFPILISIVQRLVGFREFSPFIVNYISLVIFYFLSLVWGMRKKQEGNPFALVLLLFMNPILAIYSTCAGYDLVSLTVGFAFFLQAISYFENKEDDKLRSLILAGICFGYVRYESSFVLFLLAWYLVFEVGIVAAIKKIGLGHLTLFCFLLAPSLLQRVLTFGQFENPPGVPPFSPHHFVAHFPSFLKSFFLDFNGPYPVVLHWLGVAGVLFAAIDKIFIQSRASRMTGEYMVFLFILLLSHHFGFADHPTQARLFLPLTIALSLMALSPLEFLSGYVGRVPVFLFLLLLTFHHQSFAQLDDFATRLTEMNLMAHERRYLARFGSRDNLYVYDRPGKLSAFGYSVISWYEFQNRRKTYEDNLRMGLFQKIILLRHECPDPDNEIELKVMQEIKGNIVAKYEISPEQFLKIIEIVPNLGLEKESSISKPKP